MKIEMFSKYKTPILAVNVMVIKIKNDNIFVIFSDFFFPYKICNILFNILPPSYGYIGIELNTISKKFEYIINKFENTSISEFITTIIIKKFTKGPAKAINIFFNSNKLPFNIFLL